MQCTDDPYFSTSEEEGGEGRRGEMANSEQPDNAKHAGIESHQSEEELDITDQEQLAR